MRVVPVLGVGVEVLVIMDGIRDSHRESWRMNFGGRQRPEENLGLSLSRLGILFGLAGKPNMDRLHGNPRLHRHVSKTNGNDTVKTLLVDTMTS